MDESTRQEIERRAVSVLNEARLVEPPINIEEVLEFLKVNRKFYDLEDPSLLQRFTHKLRIGGQRFVAIARKINLAAIWAPDENIILIDHSQPEPKQLWASFHDATHRLLPWHREYFLGDTAQTLEPSYQEMLEEEANYGASALMFGPKFTVCARSLPVGWAAIETLKRLHKKSYVTVLRRYVEHGLDIELAGLVSTAPWDVVPEDQTSRSRHFVTSPQFLRAFPEIEGECLRQIVDQNVSYRRGGPLGQFQLDIQNSDGKRFEFRAECFYNTHYVMSLFYPDN